MKRLQGLVLILTLLLLGACESRVIRSAQYWQRVSASEAAYIQGPKAQQMLHRDIAGCVTELQELERLGTLRNAIPTDVRGRVLGPDKRSLRDWDTPERTGALLAEHGQYHNFETCMLAKGWERVRFVPYDVEERARDTYFETVREPEDEDEAGFRQTAPIDSNTGPAGNLNE